MELTSGARSDEDVWRAAVEGSAEAWGDLFVRHHRAVYNFCLRRTALWSAAEDLTSAVFLEAWRRRREVRLYGDSALPWLYGIATMLTRNHERTLRRYQAALARIPVAQDCDEDPAELVATRMDAQRRAADLREVLAELPRRDQEILELAAGAQLSHAEIATALGVAVGTVKSRLSRARRKLGLATGTAETNEEI